MTKGRVIKNKKNNYLFFLKRLSQYINNNVNNLEQLSFLITKHKINKRELFKRLISYIYSSPYIIHYINQYFNNKFDFYSFDEIELINSIKFIIKQNNIKQLSFIKSSELKDINKPIIKKIFKKYFNVVLNQYINDLELNFLYELNKNDFEYIEELNTLLNGSESKLNLQPIIAADSKTNQIDQEKINEKIQEQISKPLSTEIINYNQKLIQQKSNNEICQKCHLFEHKMIPIDGNITEPGNIDIMFILLNPGYNESLYNRLLVGESGKLFRSHLISFDENIKYVITNIVMCSTKTQTEIGKTDKKIKTIVKNCSTYLEQIIKDFPAKIYVPIGKQAMEAFNISGSIIQNSGKVFNQNVIPIVHPSAVLKNESNKIIFEKSFETLNIVINKIIQSKQNINIFKSEKKKKDILSRLPKVNDPSIKYNIPSENIISEINETLTYLDSVTLEYDDIVHIYLDPEGNKKYLFDKIKLPIYIKDSQFNDRNLLTDKVDYVFYVNKNQKYNLTRVLSDQIIKLRTI